MSQYGIYVPKQGTVYAGHHPNGTGFVGEKRGESLLLHHEEPGHYNNVITYEDRLSHAAGRLHEKYPTSKMCGGNPDDFDLVGFVTHCEGVGWYISLITDKELLEQWAPGPHNVGGSQDFHQRAMMRNIQGK